MESVASYKTIQRARVEELSERYAHARVAEPRVNPLQYSSRRSSYPSDRHHVDWRDPEVMYYTRLHFAVRANDIEQIRSLIEDRGANPWVRDYRRKRPLDVAFDWGQWEAARCLAGHMDRIAKECLAYTRLTGKKLGLRSQRRRRPERRRPRVYAVVDDPTYLGVVQREFERTGEWLPTVTHDLRSAPYHY